MAIQQSLCSCYTKSWPMTSVKREYKQENCASGAMVRWVVCTCKKCGRSWEENVD